MPRSRSRSATSRTGASHVAFVRALAGLRQVAVVALAILPLVIVALVLSPSLLVLPFRPGGTERALKLIGKLIAWTRVVLGGR